MAKIFTKLNLADIVATSGGKSFRKLSTEEPLPKLATPTISLDGDVLTITDDSGLATSFDILVDGEVKYTYAKYLYNGVSLPPIPDLQNYPYCWIRKHNTNGEYQLICAKYPWYYKSGGMYCSGGDSAVEPWYNISISTADIATGWTFNKNATGYFTVDDAKPVFWSNHDIPNGSATATAIYFEGTEPMPSNLPLTSATFDLSTLGLPDGTYNITAIAKAEGYADSAKSEAVSYDATNLVGTWVINNIIEFPNVTENTLIGSTNVATEPIGKINGKEMLQFGFRAKSYRAISAVWLETVSSTSSANIWHESNSNNGWYMYYETYKTVEFYETALSYPNANFIAQWLKANATKVG